VRQFPASFVPRDDDQGPPKPGTCIFCGATPKPYMVLPGPYPCPDDNDFFDSHSLPTLHPPLSPYHPSVSSCAPTRLLLERLKHAYLSVVLLMRRVVPQERLVKPTLYCDSSCVHLIRQSTGRPNPQRSRLIRNSDIGYS
jgi:hypothetical protein